MNLFNIEPLPQQRSNNDTTCRHCANRLSIQLNEYSQKVIQCCKLQPSRRSNSGYKSIKVTNKACMFFKSERGGAS